MIIHDPAKAAAAAVTAKPSRPATAVVHDSPDARLVVFRIEPGQQVAPHTSPSTVLLSVLSGSGIVSDAGDERTVGPGALITFAPDEVHGMRALDERFCVLAVIAPRPGAAH
jgi:quercetin dioxygenase-like cupin family protein